MDRHLAAALSLAWAEPKVRAGLHDLLDLPQTGALLSSLAGGQDNAVLVDLLEAATATPSIQQALLVPFVQAPLAARLLSYLATLPQVGHETVTALGLALNDPEVRHDLRIILETADTREAIWRTVRARLDSSFGRLIWRGLGLVTRHHEVVKLVHALRRHGVIRALRYSRSA